MNDGLFQSPDLGDTWERLGLEARVMDVSRDPAEPGSLLVASFDGVFRNDGTEDWVDSSDGLNAANITALAFHPELPGVIYAGGVGFVARSENGGGQLGQACLVTGDWYRPKGRVDCGRSALATDGLCRDAQWPLS